MARPPPPPPPPPPPVAPPPPPPPSQNHAADTLDVRGLSLAELRTLAELRGASCAVREAGAARNPPALSTKPGGAAPKARSDSRVHFVICDTRVPISSLIGALDGAKLDTTPDTTFLVWDLWADVAATKPAIPHAGALSSLMQWLSECEKTCFVVLDKWERSCLATCAAVQWFAAIALKAGRHLSLVLSPRERARCRLTRTFAAKAILKELVSVRELSLDTAALDDGFRSIHPTLAPAIASLRDSFDGFVTLAISLHLSKLLHACIVGAANDGAAPRAARIAPAAFASLIKEAQERGGPGGRLLARMERLCMSGVKRKKPTIEDHSLQRQDKQRCAWKPHRDTILEQPVAGS